MSVHFHGPTGPVYTGSGIQINIGSRSVSVPAEPDADAERAAVVADDETESEV